MKPVVMESGSILTSRRINLKVRVMKRGEFAYDNNFATPIASSTVAYIDLKFVNLYNFEENWRLWGTR